MSLAGRPSVQKRVRADGNYKAIILVPSVPLGASRDLRAIFEARAVTTIYGTCPICSATRQLRGVDHREYEHVEFEHEFYCPVGNDRLAELVEASGFEVDPAAVSPFLVEYTPDGTVVSAEPMRLDK